MSELGDPVMLEKIKRELEEGEFYGLANDRIKWLIRELEQAKRELAIAKAGWSPADDLG